MLKPGNKIRAHPALPVEDASQAVLETYRAADLAAFEVDAGALLFVLLVISQHGDGGQIASRPAIETCRGEELTRVRHSACRAGEEACTQAANAPW